MDSAILEEEDMHVARAIGKYFIDSVSTVNVIDWPQFRGFFFLKNPNLNADKRAYYTDLINRLEKYEPEESIKTITKTLLQRIACVKVTEIGLAGADGEDINLDDISDVVAEFKMQTEIEEDLDILADVDMEELYTEIGGMSGGLHWRLNELNTSLGPLRKGDFMVVGKKPEMGGTTFLCSEMSHMGTQLPDDQVVLWFNNEEINAKVLSRVHSAACATDRRTIEANIFSDWLLPNGDTVHGFHDMYSSIMGRADRVVLVGVHGKDTHFVERVIKRYEGRLGIIVFDQLWKLAGFGGPGGIGDVNRTQQIFNWARNLAAAHAPVVAVCQCDDGQRGAEKEFLSIEDFYGSRVAIQGEADVLLTVTGHPSQVGKEYIRNLNVCKNKLMGDLNSDETKRHHRFYCNINPQIARYSDL